jgi:hypothetical protein
MDITPYRIEPEVDDVLFLVVEQGVYLKMSIELYYKKSDTITPNVTPDRIEPEVDAVPSLGVEGGVEGELGTTPGPEREATAKRVLVETSNNLISFKESKLVCAPGRTTNLKVALLGLTLGATKSSESNTPFAVPLFPINV